MRVEYQRDVQEPSIKAGEKGQVKDLPSRAAQDLIRTGHARPVDDEGPGDELASEPNPNQQITE